MEPRTPCPLLLIFHPACAPKLKGWFWAFVWQGGVLQFLAGSAAAVTGFIPQRWGPGQGEGGHRPVGLGARELPTSLHWHQPHQCLPRALGIQGAGSGPWLLGGRRHPLLQGWGCGVPAVLGKGGAICRTGAVLETKGGSLSPCRAVKHG